MTMMTPALPFGKHKNEPLAAVPTDYLRWALATVKLSSGLRAAVAAELTRRGITPPPPPPSAPVSPCERCSSKEVTFAWIQDKIGRRQIRRSCGRCGGSRGFAPQVEPFVTLANAGTSPTPVLDLLTRCEEAGINLKSDGIVVDFATQEDYLRASPGLRVLVRACRSTLGKLLGRRQVV
jgi:hypothetical protein